MARYAVVILGQASNPHVEAFRLPAKALAAALGQLGHDVWPVMRLDHLDGDLPDGRVPVVLGAVHAHALGATLPAAAVVYNLEQAGSAWFGPDYLRLCRKHPVWDYSEANAERVRELHGVRACVVVPLADTHPSTLRTLERLPPDQLDVDVVMVGARSERRAKLVEDMRARGLRVERVEGYAPGDYGARRDELLSRCRLAVNAHYYGPNAPFESARVSHLVACGVPVLSETCSAVDPWAVESVEYRFFDGLVEAAAELVQHQDEELARAEHAREALEAYAPVFAHKVKLGLEAAAAWAPEIDARPLPAARLALCMVATDEEETIGRALDSVLPAVDGWVVSYNGRGERTKEIIRQKLGHLPGELVERSWVSYGHNRTEVMRLARERDLAQYLLIVDADEVLEDFPGALEIPAGFDGFTLAERMGEMEQQKTRVVRTRAEWRYLGSVHEYIHCPGAVTGELPLGVRNLRDGAGSKAIPRERYLAEAAMLRAELDADPSNSRAAYYLAQSLELAGETDEALAMYERRACMVGWVEETWSALQRKAQAYTYRGNPTDCALVPGAFLRAWQYRPTRAEPLVELARWHRCRGEWHLALLAAERAAQIPRPLGDRLFVYRDVYEWRARDEFALALHGVGRSEEALAVALALLATMRPGPDRDRVTRNVEFFDKAARAKGGNGHAQLVQVSP